jgi:hypothetical protein
MAPAVELLTRIGHLRKEVAVHKSAIRRNKEALHLKAAQLAELETECRRRGIALILIHPQPGEGDSTSWPHVPLPHS